MTQIGSRASRCLLGLAALAFTLGNSGCGPSGCVDDLVCEQVLAKYGITDERSIASKRFELDGATYDFVQVTREGICCGGPDYFCEIWDVSAEEGVLFAANIWALDLQAEGTFDVGCRYGDTTCEWPAYSHPLVSEAEFLSFAQEGNRGFMGYCRNWLHNAERLGALPPPP